MSDVRSPTPEAAPGELRGRQPPETASAMNEEIDRFLAEQGRRWSPGTLSRYRWFLRDLAEWLSKQGIEDPTKGDLVRWLDARMRWASPTQYTATIACRSYFRWRLGRSSSPAEGIPLPRRSYRPQRSLDDTRVMRLLASLDTSTVKGRRDTAIVLLMLDTGLRASEVCRLRLEHLDLAERKLTVRIKGGRWADGVFCAYTSSCLAEWISDRVRVACEDAPEVFVAIGGGTPGRRLTVSGLRLTFRRIGERAGFALSPHDLRRTFATLSLRSGAPSRLVQVAGRWNTIEQVERYSAAITASDFEAYSPVARVMGLRVGEARS